MLVDVSKLELTMNYISSGLPPWQTFLCFSLKLLPAAELYMQASSISTATYLSHKHLHV